MKKRRRALKSNTAGFEKNTAGFLSKHHVAQTEAQENVAGDLQASGRTRCSPNARWQEH
ncbi:hypothetical protein JCM6292_1305 [Bacteroides pyogenes JCM 6292]|uniref:Uncharacterized protein n=1 Tax=Bacteroides pyogenes JCM 6292 TaxID=1235809 RepID=W4P6P0_9BACE|nr:hypothetical protein JCM6292_1305 [Bacteroides pyogenes JCM 6292]